MRCPRCGSEQVGERPERTALGYRRFRCRACGKQSNERSGTALNRTQYPADVIALVVLWRLRCQLSLRDLVVRCRQKIPSGQEPPAEAVRLPKPERGYQLSASHH
jgi:transposase-like protein